MWVCAAEVWKWLSFHRAGIKEQCGGKAGIQLKRQGGPITRGHNPTRESGVFPKEKCKASKKKREHGRICKYKEHPRICVGPGLESKMEILIRYS